ncbi:MAG: sensor histidine kinase, partial [Gammaproteobacteria bacterium]|nr:sensor histidine kinase [Gammaproteobacteria bacterium]
ALAGRAPDDLSPIEAPDAPRELRPLIDATTQVMARLQHLLDHQKRFVRDSAHQLRTPLAVLKAQVQSARRGDVPPDQAFDEIGQTVDRATLLANQMLSLAKVEQLRQQPEWERLDLREAVREVALDLSPLIAARSIDFELDASAAPVPVQAHRWMLHELSRNLLHNAIKHSPRGGTLRVDVCERDGEALLRISDAGPGISEELRKRLFAPFSAGDASTGSGLGLAICQEIALALRGHLAMRNLDAGGHVAGLEATATFPIASDNG